MTRIAVTGISGRMGSAIARECLSHPSLQLSAVYDRVGSECIGQPLTDLGISGSDLTVSDNIADEFDVLVDFTAIAASMQHLAVCRDLGKAIFIGTTGMGAGEYQQLDTAAQDIPVILAANTSLGVVLMQRLLADAAKALDNDFDIEIVESHHRRKIDAPSGTAWALARSICSAKGWDVAKQTVTSRSGETGERPEQVIGMSTIRGGDIVGEHTAMFISDFERIELTHKATDRRVFANGALRGAHWLSQQAAGRYEMADVLGLD